MGTFNVQRLGGVQPRTENVTRAVRQLELAKRGRLTIHAAIEDLHLLYRLQVVVHDHPLAPDDARSPQLRWRQPAELDLRQDAAGELEREKRHVLQRFAEVRPAARAHLDRHFAEPVDQDRHVMWPEVPQHAHVFLEQPEVDARGFDVVDRSDQTCVDQLLYFADRWTEHEGVADHQRQPTGTGQLDQLLRLIDGRCQRLFDEHMFLRFERALHQRVV